MPKSKRHRHSKKVVERRSMRRRPGIDIVAAIATPVLIAFVKEMLGYLL
ncbi:hypothetical protein [Aminobacter sp. DSM 101952]|nr:hypothetical protein [Aminobacter sp. DSM 101952]